MKEKMYKVLSHLFQYVGTKQLVMCCHGILFETKIPDELKATYADIAKGYFKRHPEYLNKE